MRYISVSVCSIFQCLIFTGCAFLHAIPDNIALFESDVTVNVDGSILIRETIIARKSDGDAIKRGISREIPTRWVSWWGNNQEVDFELVRVLKDGRPYPYEFHQASNGIVLIIKDGDRVLRSGQHEYTITYTLKRMLGFFPDYDELYLNVNGAGWRLAIDQVNARVILPATVSRQGILLSGYTGRSGGKGKDYVASIEPDGAVLFKSIRRFQPQESLTISASWLPGAVYHPNQVERIWSLVSDNRVQLWYLLCLILVFLLYGVAWLYNRRMRSGKPVIPLFYPPENPLLKTSNLTPAQVRYMVRGTMDPTAFSSEIVFLAVNGVLKIAYNAGKVWGGTYTLESVGDIQFPEGYNDAWISQTNLLSRRTAVGINNANRSVLASAFQNLKNSLDREFGSHFFSLNTEVVVFAVATSVAALLIPYLLPESFIGYLGGNVVVFAGIAHTLLNFFGIWLLSDYSSDGHELRRQIDGFKMFLEATEKERFAVIGTPPTRTPELYEQYLPYAMALGVEKQWSSQFVTVFKNLEQEGHAYTPMWYRGSVFNAAAMSTWSSSFSQSLNSSFSSYVVSSSSSGPGYSSGRGGGGSAGGGGGGGGGGGV